VHEICQFILSKIIKVVAANFEILRRKCTKFDFDWGSTDLARAAYSSPPIPLAGIQGAYFKGRGGEKKRKGGEGKSGSGRGRGKGALTWLESLQGSLTTFEHASTV